MHDVPGLEMFLMRLTSEAFVEVKYEEVEDLGLVMAA